MVRCLRNGRYSPGRESDCVSGVGRAGRAVVPGGLPETRWLGSGGAGAGREPAIFTRRNDSGFTAADETATSCAEPDWRWTKPAFGGGEITSLKSVAWFPDGKHLLLTGAAEGQPLRSYEVDIDGGKPQAVGPADFTGVANDGKRIAGRNASAETAVFDRGTQKLQVIPGIEPQESVARWTENGQALVVYSSTPSKAQIYRVEVGTGKRTLLHTVEPGERAGSTMPMRLPTPKVARPTLTALCGFWESCTWWKGWSKESAEPPTISELSRSVPDGGHP